MSICECLPFSPFISWSLPGCNKKRGRRGQKHSSLQEYLGLTESSTSCPFYLSFSEEAPAPQQWPKKWVSAFDNFHNSPTIAVPGNAYLIKHVLESFLRERTALDVLDSVKILGKLLSLLELYH